MTVEMLNHCLSELSERDRLAMLDCVMFAKLLNMRAQSIKSSEVGDIWGLGNKLEPKEVMDSDFKWVVYNAIVGCKHAVDKLRIGYTSPEVWGLTWEEYYLFNRVVNSNLAKRLGEIYSSLYPEG